MLNTFKSQCFSFNYGYLLVFNFDDFIIWELKGITTDMAIVNSNVAEQICFIIRNNPDRKKRREDGKSYILFLRWLNLCHLGLSIFGSNTRVKERITH